ncbi:50S ribosomal protein L21 [bacterium]|nr:50S ribosomal protein L21 [bacterium]
MIAIIEIKGKQYRVAEQQVFRTLQVAGEPGDTVNADRVLATIEGDKLNLGKPALEGAAVTLEIVRHAKTPKITVFRFQSKKNVKRTKGYRDKISYLRVKSISA